MESGRSRHKTVKLIQFLGLHLKSNLDWEDEIKAIVRK
jgi:hypothetical protein